jgi:hypothetical protein
MSGYHIPCLCGKTVITESKTAVCPGCGRELRIEGWGEMPVKEIE